MKKKIRNLVAIIALILAGVIYADNEFELGIVDTFMQATDREAPTIQSDALRGRYLLNEDVSLEPECEDNVDETCEVEVVGDFDTSVLGEHTVTLEAVDSAGNVTTYDYTYEVLENVDGSIYIPTGYYDSAEDLSGEDLKAALHSIIKDHVEYPYTDDDTDVWDILREADEDPNNPDNVIGFYTGLSIPKDCQQGSSTGDCEIDAYGEVDTVSWNREHIWSKSRGDFDDASDMGPYTDTHHLVAAERSMNSLKNNRFYEDCGDGDDTNIEERDYGNYTCNEWEFEPRDEVKGDAARMIFYMAVRYEGADLDLEVVDDPDEDSSLKLPVYGDLDDLLRWHKEDPVSEEEVMRNEVIYTYQENRNPFIDNPDYVSDIWE